MKDIDKVVYAIAFDSLDAEIEKEKLKLRDAKTEAETTFWLKNGWHD